MNYPMQARFRDEEAVILNLIRDYFTSVGETVYTGDETPDNLSERLPFVRAGRVGGAPRAGEEHTDRPVVDIDVYAATRADAKRIATTIEQFLLSAPHPIDHCNVLMSPQRVQWVQGQPIRRFYASYHFGLRR